MKSHLKNKRTTKYSFGRTALFESDIKHLRKQFKNCCNNCYINFTGKKKKGMKAFITSQLRDCPLVWIFQGWCLNNKINSLHKEVLKITIKIILALKFWRTYCNNNSFQRRRLNFVLHGIESGSFLSSVIPSRIFVLLNQYEHPNIEPECSKIRFVKRP